MMVEKIKNNVKREKGITLVALVVTIVVLLILAFISISLLTGENGIINKAEESKEETIKAKEREMIQLTYQDLEMEYTLKGTDITAERVWEKLKEYENNIKVEMKAKEELGETEIVVEKNSGEEYAEITYEEIVGINTIVQAEMIPGLVKGMITLVNVWNGLAPKS